MRGKWGGGCGGEAEDEGGRLILYVYLYIYLKDPRIFRFRLSSFSRASILYLVFSTAAKLLDRAPYSDFGVLQEADCRFA